MRPFTVPISERSRQKYGVYQPRYEKISSMRPFTAKISDRERELYGEYAKRYETETSMKPFDAPISERSRELYGEYMRRYEDVSSMSAFDSEIGSYKRNLYGEYRTRWSIQKIGDHMYEWDDANGVNWVDMPDGLGRLSPTKHDVAIYRAIFYFSGWAGTPQWRVMVDGTKVYPFSSYDAAVDNTLVLFGTLSTMIRTGEVGVLQFRSDNAIDGAGDTLYVGLDLAYLTKS